MLSCCSQEYFFIGFVLVLLIILLYCICRKSNIIITQTNNNNPPPPPPPPAGGGNKPSKWKPWQITVLIVISLLILASITAFLICHEGTELLFVYDTDQLNDRFIKDGLTVPQLKLLDTILAAEKKNGGKRLGKDQLERLIGGNYEIDTAYDRWRACYDLRRSSSRVIYPDERLSCISNYNLNWVEKSVMNPPPKWCRYVIKFRSQLKKLGF